MKVTGVCRRRFETLLSPTPFRPSLLLTLALTSRSTEGLLLAISRDQRYPTGAVSTFCPVCANGRWAGLHLIHKLLLIDAFVSSWLNNRRRNWSGFHEPSHDGERRPDI